MFAKLDAVIEGLEEAVAAETAQQAQVTRIAAASGVTLSVGFVVWALRSTALLASLFATVPAWQMLDPLPVVASHRRERTLRKRQPVLGGYDPGDYRQVRAWARSTGGVQVPVSIVHREIGRAHV